MSNMYDALQDELKRQREVKALEGSVVLTPEENLENQLSPENLATGMGMGSVGKIGDEAGGLLGPKAKAFLAKYGPSRSAATQKAIQGSELQGEQLASDLAPKGESGLGSKYEQFGNPLVDKVNAQESSGFNNSPKVDPNVPNLVTNQQKLDFLRGKPQDMSFTKEELSPFGNHVPDNQSLPQPNEPLNNSMSTPLSPIPTAGLAAGGTALGAAALNSDTKENKSQSSTQQPEAANFLNSMGMGPPPIPLKNEALPPIPLRNDYKPEEQPVQKPEEQPVDVSSKEEQSTDSSGPDVKVPEAPSMPKTQELAKMMATDEGQEKFADVLHRRDLSVLANQLGQAGNIIGSAIARQEPNAAATKVFQENVAIAQGMPQDFKNKIAAQEEDPDSAVSKNYRDFLTKYGVNVGPGITAKQIKDTLLPAAEKEKLLNEKLQSNKDTKEIQMKYLAQKNGETNAWKEVARQDKLDKHNVDRIDKASKLITAEVGSSRSAFGRAANTHQAAEKIDALASSMDPNNLDNRQIAEVARNLDAMLTTGQPTISGMNKLIPSSFSGDASKIQEYIMGIPKGAQQGEFVKRMLDTVHREKELSVKQIQETQTKLLGSYSDLKDNDSFKTMLQTHGLPENVFKDPQIEKWAKQHSLDYDKAVQIIEARKQGKQQ